MKDLETTKYLIMPKNSLMNFFRKTFHFNAQDKIYEEANSFFESEILKDINSIQFNSINFGDAAKSNQYLNILDKRLNSAFWRITKYSTDLSQNEIEGKISTENNNEKFLENILLNEIENETENIIIDSLTEYLYQLNEFVRNFRNDFFPNTNSFQNNYLITDNNSNKIQMPLMAVRGQFAALIDTEQLIDENGEPINKNNAGRILSEHITFLQKNGKPYEISVVSKYFSSSFERNDTAEFIEPYNECIEKLGRPKFKKG